MPGCDGYNAEQDPAILGIGQWLVRSSESKTTKGEQVLITRILQNTPTVRENTLENALYGDSVYLF